MRALFEQLLLDLKQCRDDCEGKDKAEVRRLRKAYDCVRREAYLQANSVSNFIPCTWGLPFGDNPQGIYGACPPEILHQFDLGILKTVWVAILQRIAEDAEADPENGSKRERLERMDARFCALKVRHADPLMPRERMTTGASSVTGRAAHEFSAIMWQFIVVLGGDLKDESLLRRENKQRILDCVYKLVELRARLWARDIPESEVVNLESVAIPAALQAMKDAIPSASDFRFPKFHLTTHYGHFIREFGSLHAIDSGHGERAQKIMKKLFKITSRRRKTAMAELGVRVATFDATAQLVEAFDVYTRRQLRLKKKHARAEPGQGRHMFKGKAVWVSQATATATDQNGAVFKAAVKALDFPEGKSDTSKLFYELHKLGRAKGVTDVNRGRDAFWRNYQDPAVLRELHMEHGTVRKGRRTKMILRAHPRVEFSPWYDFVRVKVPEGGEPEEVVDAVEERAQVEEEKEVGELDDSVEGDEEDMPAAGVVINFYAAELIAFVALWKKGEEHHVTEPRMMAFVRYFKSALPRSLSTVDVEHLEARHIYTKLALIRQDPDAEMRFALVDTEAIAGALWVENNPAISGTKWVLSTHLCHGMDELEYETIPHLPTVVVPGRGGGVALADARSGAAGAGSGSGSGSGSGAGAGARAGAGAGAGAGC
jgi:hypothetical protein